jgi:hypothetical protein
MMRAEFVPIEADWNAAASTMRGCEVRRLTDNSVLRRLARSDHIGNYDKLGGNVHAGLRWSTNFSPSAAQDQRAAAFGTVEKRLERRAGRASQCVVQSLTGEAQGEYRHTPTVPTEEGHLGVGRSRAPTTQAPAFFRAYILCFSRFS